MTKIGIGQNNKDIDITIDQVGLKTALAVELLDSSGNNSYIDTGFKLPQYDAISMTYDTANNITSVTYTLLTVIVAVLTLTYDSSNNLTSVIRTI